MSRTTPSTLETAWLFERKKPMSVIYMHLQYEDYKFLQEQMRAFKETSHKSEGGFYHKSIRLHVGDLIVEFHGPLVGGYGHLEPKDA